VKRDAVTAGKSVRQTTVTCSHCIQKSVAAPNAACCDQRRPPGVADSPSSGTRSNRDEASASLHRKPGSSQWVMAVCAAECQGHSTISFSLPVSIVPGALALTTPSSAGIETVRLESERLQPTSLQPPLPPPKIV
jgi:hypothetical protein